MGKGGYFHPMDLDILIGRLKERIEAAGTNPNRLATECGYDRTFLVDLFLGRKKSISVKALTKFAAHLNTDVAYFTGEQDVPRQRGLESNEFTVHQRLKIARQFADLSQADLGAELELTRNAVSMWETGPSLPSTKNLEAISIVARVNYEWLATGRGDLMSAEILQFAPSVGMRLRYSRAKAMLSRDELSKLSGVSLKTIAGIEDGNISHSPEAEQLAQTLHVSADWLRHGDGKNTTHQSESPLHGNVNIERMEHTRKIISPSGESPEGAALPVGGVVLELDARRPGRGQHGGEDAAVPPKAKWFVPEDFLNELNVLASNTRVIEVLTDAMAPTFLGGDRVVVDTTQTNPNAGGIYAIDEGDGPKIQRLQVIKGTDPEEVMVKFDNPLQDSYRVLLQDIEVIGLVRAKITKKF